MNRIVLSMAVTNYLLVAITMFLGVLSEPSRGFVEAYEAEAAYSENSAPASGQSVDAHETDERGNTAFAYHFLLGIATALFTMLVHCIVFTYFLGTSRWVKETAGAYAMDRSFQRTSEQCRIRAMMAAFVGILLVVGTVASGAAAHTGHPVWIHQLVPLLTYAYTLFAFHVEITQIEKHMGLTEDVMVEVNRIRKERGLELL